MLKMLVICAILVLTAAGVPRQSDKVANTENCIAKSERGSCANDPREQSGSVRQTASDSDEKSLDWRAAVEQPEWWLVVVGFITFGIVGWQAILMRLHAGHFESLAGAAATNAQAATDAATAAKDMLELSRDTAQRQLRAYVVVERGIIANVANPIPYPGQKVETVARLMQLDAGPTVQITIKNTGQTPAYELVHWGRLCVEDFPLTPRLPTMPGNAGKFCTVMGPGIVEVKTIRLPPLTTEQIQALHKGTKAIYCNGEIHYRDAFKNWRVTKYRCMYASGVSGRIGVGTDMTYCEEGNEAT